MRRPMLALVAVTALCLAACSDDEGAPPADGVGGGGGGGGSGGGGGEGGEPGGGGQGGEGGAGGEVGAGGAGGQGGEEGPVCSFCTPAGEPRTVEFGDTEVGQRSQQTFTLENTADNAVRLTFRPITGPFTVECDGGCPPELDQQGGARDSVELTLSFAPIAGGNQAGSLVIATDPGTGVEFAMSGYSYSREVGCTPPEGVIDFGVMVPPGMPQKRTITCGTSSLLPESVQITFMPDDATYTTNLPPGGAVPPGGMLQIEITGTPATPGPHNAQMKIETPRSDLTYFLQMQSVE